MSASGINAPCDFLGVKADDFLKEAPLIATQKGLVRLAVARGQPAPAPPQVTAAPLAFTPPAEESAEEASGFSASILQALLQGQKKKPEKEEAPFA